MINSIVYKSNTGFTEKYAKMLSEEINVPVYSLDNINKLDKNKKIIFMGSVFANNINGYKKAITKFNIKAVIAVGMAEPSKENDKQLKETNKIESDFFYLQGGLDKDKLKGFKKIIINLIGKSLEKKPEKDQKIINIFKNGGNFISKDNLKDIINWHKEK